MTRMKYIGAEPTSLADGQHVEPYTVIDVPQAKKGEYALHDQSLIDAGLLIDAALVIAKSDAKDSK